MEKRSIIESMRPHRDIENNPGSMSVSPTAASIPGGSMNPAAAKRRKPNTRIRSAPFAAKIAPRRRLAMLKPKALKVAACKRMKRGGKCP